MPYNCRDICGFIDEYAPPQLALEGDPIGLHLGSYNQTVNRLFMALELTPDVAREALEFQPDMIVLHHTPFFQPIKQLLEGRGHDRIVLELIRSGVALYTAHTNLDCVKGGVNDALAEKLGLTDTEVLKPLNQSITDAGLGRIGMLKAPTALGDFAAAIKKALGAKWVRYCGDGSQKSYKVALCGGAGAFLISEAVACGADTFVTSDVSHHEGVMALELGLGLIDAGHFATENQIIPVLADWLRGRLPGLAIGLSAISGDPFSDSTI